MAQRAIDRREGCSSRVSETVVRGILVSSIEKEEWMYIGGGLLALILIIIILVLVF